MRDESPPLASDACFRRFFDTAVDMHCVADVEGFIRAVNPAWERALGWSPAELCGRPYLDFVHPDDIDATIQAATAIERGETVTRFTNRYRTKQGGWRHLEWCALQHAENGLVYGTVRDVSDERGMALHIAEIEAVSGVGSWGLDLDTKRLQWSRQTFAIHDLDGPDPPPLEDALAFYPSEARAQLEPALARLMETGETFDLELPFETARGRRRWVRATAALERRGGRIARVFGTFQDITDAKQAKRRLADIIRGTNAGTWEWNVQTGETRFNARWAEIIGYTLEEISPSTVETWMRFTHPDDLAEAEKRLKAHFSGENPCYECELRMRHRDGHWVWVLALGRVASRTAGGQPDWMSGTHIDITERKAHEAVLKAAREAAEEASRAKSSFLANMSHEIRTPLNGVIGMAEVLEGAVNDPDHRRVIGVIRESGELLLNVINDILDLSKIEAGKMDIATAPFDPGHLARKMETAFTLKADQKGLALIVETTSSEGRRRLGDEHRLLQILHNLVGNALKFTETGTVSVRIDNQPARPLVVSVSDTGIGMTPGQVDRMFDIFAQADSTTTRRFGGSGLGLSIVKRLVELMGGESTVASAPGVGTTIRISLPLEELADTDAALVAPETPAPPLAPLRVLAAEDNEINRMVLSAMLAQLGQTATFAENGAEAVAAFAAGAFDLLLFDISMPVMDGVEAISRVRALEAERSLTRTPAISVTANALSHQIETFMEAGFDAHVAKPIDLGRLDAAIRGVLAQA